MSSRLIFDAPPTPPPEVILEDLLPGYIYREAQRTGGPTLCPLPAITLDISVHSDYYLLFTTYHHYLTRQVASILLDNNVDYESIKLCSRQSLNNPQSRPVPTVVVQAEIRQYTSGWVFAADDILTFLERSGIQGVSVEIADPDALYPQDHRPQETFTSLYSIWDRVPWPLWDLGSSDRRSSVSSVSQCMNELSVDELDLWDQQEIQDPSSETRRFQLSPLATPFVSRNETNV